MPMESYHGLAQLSDSSPGNSRATTVTLYPAVDSARAAERPMTPEPMIPTSMLLLLLLLLTIAVLLVVAEG